MISTLEFLSIFPVCPICKSKIDWIESGAYSCINPKCKHFYHNIALLFRNSPETITTIRLGDVIYQYLHQQKYLTYYHHTDVNRSFMRYIRFPNITDIKYYINSPGLLIDNFYIKGAFLPNIAQYKPKLETHICKPTYIQPYDSLFYRYSGALGG